MNINSLFLSLDEDLPLGIFWSDDHDSVLIPLDEFMRESMIDLSPKQAKRYEKEFSRLSELFGDYAKK